MLRLLRLAETPTPAHYPLRSLALAAAVVGAAGIALALAKLRRLEVVGSSMQPTLEPGERVLTVRGRRARPGDLVVVPDPRVPTRLMVKRVVEASRTGLTLKGDNEMASTDSRTFGPVAAGSVRGRVVYRYHPGSRRGPLP